jgi:hypothetical protein
VIVTVWDSLNAIPGSLRKQKQRAPEAELGGLRGTAEARLAPNQYYPHAILVSMGIYDEN